MLTLEAQEEMNRVESLGECWETIGCNDSTVKNANVEDHRIKGGNDCSSHKQPMGWEGKDSTLSTEETHH